MTSVRRTLLFLLVVMSFLSSGAQNNREKLTGDWKSYLSDKTSFEFLRLNADGTGLKCFGQTINGKDSLFLNHVTTLLITDWTYENGKLTINSKNTVSFKVNPEYTVNWFDDSIQLKGEHLIYYLYPSHLNRNEFHRSVTYQRTEKISGGHGVLSATCIIRDGHVFSFKSIDDATQLASYKGFDDLIPYIVSCNNGFEYVQKYHDPPYSIIIPKFFDGWSFGFGNKNFYISLEGDKTDKTETSIVIYYDFGDEMKDFYFSEIKKGKEKRNIVKQGNLEIYKTMNWQGKFEGKVFLPNSIIVAYYTRDKKLETLLQKCITSFQYK